MQAQFKMRKKYSDWKVGKDWFWKMTKDRDDINISENPNITLDIIKNNPEYNWDYNAMSSNPNITWDFVKSNEGKNWNWFALSGNSAITWENIKEDMTKPWDFDCVSYNPNITWEIIQRENLDRYPGCLSNPNIPWDILKMLYYKIGYPQNTGINWHNDTITSEIVRDNPKIHWDYLLLSDNPNLIDKILLEREYWNAYVFISNPGLTMDDIETHNVYWDMSDWASENPNSYEYIDSYSIDWNLFSRNDFFMNKYVFTRNFKIDLKWRGKQSKKVFEKISGFSRNIDKIILKRLNYH